MKNVLILMLVLVSGCVASGPKFSNLVEARSGFSTIYVMRKTKSYGFAYCPPVSLDGKEVGCLKNGGYLVLKVPPGSHELRFEKRALEVGKERFVSFEANGAESLFFEWSISFNGVWAVGSIAGVTGSEGIIVHTLESAMEILPKLSES